MDIRFAPVALPDIRDDIRRHLASLPSAIDSFLEDHIVASAHYRILLNEAVAGFTSVHKGSLITQFSLEPAFRRYGQVIYAQVRKLERVQSAFVPTSDEFFLSHALDDYRRLAKQAYFFAADPAAFNGETPEGFTQRPAETGDIEIIREESGDFFEDIAARIERRELFVTLSSDTIVGFGILVRSGLINGVASIGMFVPGRHRRQGAGTATLRLLMRQCLSENLRPVAGCWYYNHLSKKTLERAGMYTATRLLKIDY